MRFEELQQLISQKDLPGEKAHAPYLKYRYTYFSKRTTTLLLFN
jgi:hypothetical protein